MSSTIFIAMQDAGLPQVAGWRTAGAFVVVLLLLAGALWLLKRGGFARRTGQPMAVESALALGDRRSIAIVKVEGRRLLLGLAPGQVSFLTELQNTTAFSDAVDRAVGRGNQ
ncbi:MAG TPA: flagellar biosynthetic protein FliO [Vicinamibacterales bacterium]|nr:flagellar biosynthetic protein FliO [Vicinamibacterales bacterium]